jgi:hypothetical protein|tara:strand:+ start:221 stop:1357 length:1137 start_codon:yes stop_codon:yes gene_type:complete
MIFLLAKKDFPAPEHLNVQYEDNDVCLYLDGFWKETSTGFYKGYEYEHVKIDIADGVIEISMPFYHQSKTFYNNDTGLLITNNHAFYNESNASPCSIDCFKWDGQSNFTESVIPDYGYKDITFELAANIIEEKIYNRISSACSTYNKSVLFFSGGLDTAVVLAVIKKHNLPITVNYATSGFDIPELLQLHKKSVRTPLYNRYIESYECYKECGITEPFTGLFTGFSGGIETMRFPMHMRALYKCHGMDYDDMIDQYDNAYLTNFHISECIYDWEWYQGGDLETAKSWILNQILHNKEILPIDHHNILVPWRAPEIPQLMLGMSINDLTEQSFHSTLHKVIIENTFPDAIKLVPEQKYETINKNGRAFTQCHRRLGNKN